jgi:hypothetical protein
MHPTIKNLIERIRQAKREIIANREADALRIALDHTALIKLRLQQTGKDAQGASFEPYTIGYKKEREKAGFQTSYVDFTRTGQLLASIRPVVTKSDVFSATVEITPSTEEGKTILRGLQNKRPGILESSQEEIQLIKKLNRERILRYLNF